MARTEVENQRLADELALKLKLEKQFQKELAKFLRSVINDFKNDYKNTGLVNNPQLRQAELTQILQKRMIKISKLFSGQLREALASELDNPQFDPLLDVEINAINSADMKAVAEVQSGTILKTEGKRLMTAIAVVISAALLKGEQVNSDIIAERAAKKLKKQVDGRAQMIAQTETQFAAEHAKFNEANALSRVTTVAVAGGVLANKLFSKTWNAILDDVVRGDHAAADGQRRDLREPFNIGGFSMQKPRDGSMGAPASQLVNCRCSISYSISKKDRL